MKKQRISKKGREKAVAASSMLEGLSFKRAKQDKHVIKKLKEHGRAISL